MDSRDQYRRQQKKPMVKEEYAVVLDVLTNSSSFKDNEIVQAIGYNTYTLFELMPKQGVLVKAGQKVYIGDGKRDEIQYIKKTLKYDKLSGSAQSELIYEIMDIVEEKEKDYVGFINNAGPISLRRHSLELIPGIGKKHLKALLDIRDEKSFESFEDIKQRCSFLPDPVKSFSDRILAEIKDETDHKFFVSK